MGKMRQISSLGAAILFLTARTFGWARTVVEVCDCFQPSLEHSGEKIRIQPKHCSCAMNEINSYFPEYTRRPIGKVSQFSLNDSNTSSNFADHFIRNLQLPPVAEACIRTLFVHCKHEQVELGINSGVKISTLCAAVTYFVCSVGGAMQKVAHKVHEKNHNLSETKNSLKQESLLLQRFGKGMGASSIDTKSMGSSKEGKIDVKLLEKSQTSVKDSGDCSEEDSNSDDSDIETNPFDVFTHAAVVEDNSEKLEYQTKRMWDAWSEQMTWSRSLLEIEQSCCISSNIVLNLYKSSMFPRRAILLNALRAAVSTDLGVDSECITGFHSSLRQTPLASILLTHIPIAGELMSRK